MESYAEEKKVYLKSKNKVMRHHLHMRIRCQDKIWILVTVSFNPQFLTSTFNA